MENSAQQLLSLPDETLMQIAAYTTSTDKNNIQRTCPKLQKLISINNPQMYLYNTDQLHQDLKQYGLLLSIYKDLPHITQHMLEHGANTDSNDLLGITPLDLAHRLAKNPTTTMIAHFSTNQFAHNLCPLLLLDCFFGNLEKLKTYENLEQEICLIQKEEQYLLHTVIPFGHTSTVEYLLSYSSIFTNINTPDYTGNTSLLLAARFGYLAIIELLLKHKANANCPNNGGHLPIHEAALSHDIVECVALLCQHTDCNTKDQGKAKASALHYAAIGGNYKTVQFLCNNGADVNSLNAFQETPLLVAVRNTRKPHMRKKIVQFLLQQPGIEINGVDCHNKTPLDHADQIHDQEIIDTLVQHGAKRCGVKQ